MSTWNPMRQAFDVPVTLAAFLLARIAEDGVGARAEVERLRGAPRRSGKSSAARRWAECEAKRRIVEVHAPVVQAHATACDVCGVYGDDGDIVPTSTWHPHGDDSWPCLTLQLLALPYVDHPDYREEWRP